MSHSYPKIFTLGSRVEDAFERRDFHKYDFHSAKEIQGVALEYASLFIGLWHRITCVEFLDCGKTRHNRQLEQIQGYQVVWLSSRTKSTF